MAVGYGRGIKIKMAMDKLQELDVVQEHIDFLCICLKGLIWIRNYIYALKKNHKRKMREDHDEKASQKVQDDIRDERKETSKET